VQELLPTPPASELNPLLPGLVPAALYEYKLMTLSEKDWSSYLVDRSLDEGGPITTGIAELDALEREMFSKYSKGK
jgi:hypothetical protein